MKMSRELFMQVMAVKTFPENTALANDVVIINVGGPSPDWVIELSKTGAGSVLLRRTLAGLIRNGLTGGDTPVPKEVTGGRDADEVREDLRPAHPGGGGEHAPPRLAEAGDHRGKGPAAS